MSAVEGSGVDVVKAKRDSPAGRETDRASKRTSLHVGNRMRVAGSEQDPEVALSGMDSIRGEAQVAPRSMAASNPFTSSSTSPTFVTSRTIP